MPTQQVDPESAESLQDVANAIFKARKVVVITGAGISTNSGIPDFRSENGLYSLIQAQFDAASRQNRTQDTSPDESGTESGEERGPKRRRLSRESSIQVTRCSSEERKDEVELPGDTIRVCPSVDPAKRGASDEPQPGPLEPPLEQTTLSTPKPYRDHVLTAIPTSPLSSPPIDIVPPSIFRNSQTRFFDAPIPLSSSPLSSPPPVLFDPWASASPSDTSPSRRSSTTPSEVDDTFSSNPFSSSQTSNTGRNSLPNMKGKDLFDASIWADPMRTSVFYTFATSLRQKIRDCEPTSSHRFISHLRDRGKLVRCYTQNIDRIEEKVGLSTSLQDGPGSRGRFSRKSTNASQLSKMVEDNSKDKPGSDDVANCSNEPGQASTGPGETTATPTEDDTSGEGQLKASKPPKLEHSRSSGVECVFLHGSLESLRCFLCGRVSSWDDSLEFETLSGQQPECPHCIGATVAREERGKRALGVGKLRPDIVLYGEEHPNAHLISPIVTHDLGLCPDMLLILGTSLRVHGLKVLVREFSKAIHNRGGKVVFVNFTKPPESSWGDVIDYWVQWDCDAWVSDLQTRVPKLWEAPPPPKKKKTEEEKEKEKRERPPPVNPVALRDTRLNGAYWSLKIRDDLYKITGTPSLTWKAYEPVTTGQLDGGFKPRPEAQNDAPTEPTPASVDVQQAITVNAELAVTDEAAHVQASMEATANAAEKPNFAQKVTKAKPKRTRKSAPGALERPKKQPSSTLNPAHGRSKKAQEPLLPASTLAPGPEVRPSSPLKDARTSISSILNSVKDNPRIRKRKKIDGQEVPLPGSRASLPDTDAFRTGDSCVTLAPLTNTQPSTPPQLDHRPRPLEPSSPPSGPVARVSAGLANAWQMGQRAAIHVQGMLNRTYDWRGSPAGFSIQEQRERLAQAERPFISSERDVAMTLAGMRTPRNVMNMR